MDTDKSILPTISVLMPAFNVERYIEKAVGSILAQTVSNIELIVIDDGSTDSTLAILEKIASMDSRVLVIATGANSGVAAALNLGLAVCRAPYVARADSDDVSLPERLEKQLAFMNGRPEVSLSGCALRRINEVGEYIGPGTFIPITDVAIRRSIRWACTCIHPTWFVRRELYESLGGYRPVANEDGDFLLRAVTEGTIFGNVPDVLVEYRVRSGNTGDFNGFKMYKSWRYTQKLYRECLKYGKDSFSLTDYENAVRVSPLILSVNKPRRWLIRQAYKKAGTLRRWCFLSMAAAVSPWYIGDYYHQVCKAIALMPERE